MGRSSLMVALCFFLICTFSSLPQLSWAQDETVSPHPLARNYFAPLTSSDERNIRYIIVTLADSSILGLLGKRRRLERAGKATGHIHPLRWLKLVFTDRELRSKVVKIRSYPWRRFSRDMGDSVRKAAERNNISDNVLQDFCEGVGIEKETIQSLIAEEEWVRLVNILRERAR